VIIRVVGRLNKIRAGGIIYSGEGVTGGWVGGEEKKEKIGACLKLIE
jgi:hypothetical protein